MLSRGHLRLREAVSALKPSASPVNNVAKSLYRNTTTNYSLLRSFQSINDVHSLVQSWNPVSTVPVTIYSFPSFEPVALESWSVQHLHLPLRRDILHQAVTYEGDNTRQGTASSKTRWEVHGSHRKIRPQKGSGRARLGSKQSPLLRGGGKAFGPHPRDFGTKLNRKVYDKAWRTALSYRYRKGELFVCEDEMELPMPQGFELVANKYMNDGLREAYLKKYMKHVLHRLGLGHSDGRTLFITSNRQAVLYEAMEKLPWEGRVLNSGEVDVKDLLETGKVVIEKGTLDWDRNMGPF